MEIVANKILEFEEENYAAFTLILITTTLVSRNLFLFDDDQKTANHA